jgi:hypothetical protein
VNPEAIEREQDALAENRAEDDNQRSIQNISSHFRPVSAVWAQHSMAYADRENRFPPK